MNKCDDKYGIWYIIIFFVVGYQTVFLWSADIKRLREGHCPVCFQHVFISFTVCPIVILMVTFCAVFEYLCTHGMTSESIISGRLYHRTKLCRWFYSRACCFGKATVICFRRVLCYLSAKTITIERNVI